MEDFHLSPKGDINLLHQFNGSQLDPLLLSTNDTFLADCTNSSQDPEDGESTKPSLVSNTDKFLHNFTNYSPASDDGEDNQPPENFHRQLLHPPTTFNSFSNF